MHVRISLGNKFQLNLTVCIFWTKFTQKRYFRTKTEISRGTRFQLKLKICFLEQLSQSRVFPVENGKSERRYWTLHIRISLDTKFHVEQTSLNFGTKRGISCQKRKNWTSTIEFGTFELVYNHFHHIFRLFNVLPNFPFTTSETMRDFYLSTWDIPNALRLRILRNFGKVSKSHRMIAQWPVSPPK